MTELFLNDPDVRLYHGDAHETVRGLPSESVDCVVTSPPYWGLRDYGTGQWDGGDPDCDHLAPPGGGTGATGLQQDGRSEQARQGNAERIVENRRQQYRDVCGSCGATRIDRQLGLEPTPDLFVAGMVELFREVRRVLAPHGTCWVNLGDSYASSPPGNVAGVGATSGLHGANDANGVYRETLKAGHATKRNTVVAGLKPKDLVGIPWRVAFALQQDGWYLRSDIIWAKPNPMPESVTDRPTKAHEYVFMLTKRPRYWFDTEAVREPLLPSSVARGEYGHASFGKGQFNGSPSDERHQDGKQVRKVADLQNPAGRNVRSVWQIATQPYPEAHFATFPEELARRCILAGCPTRVCRECGKPSERIVEASYSPHWKGGYIAVKDADDPRVAGGNASGYQKDGERAPRMQKDTSTVGWSDCGHNNWRPGIVLDPFIGSGTTAKVARDHQRHAIGLDLNVTYLELAAQRLQQLSLLAEA